MTAEPMPAGGPRRPTLKRRLDELALLGAEPAFAEPLHVGRPDAVDRQRLYARLDGVFERRRLTNRGPLVRELERRIAERIGVEHCVATSSGTAALELLFRGLELSGEVVLPSFTFVATAHALRWQGLEPVFCDVDPRTHTLDPAQVERLIGPRTAAVVGVHLWGRPCDVRSLLSVARGRGLPLCFDAAHAFGCSHEGRMVGSLGDAEVFSLHATKIVHGFEGGVLTTGDGSLAARIRLLQNFGFEGYDQVGLVGTNAKMHEASAAMALTSLETFDAAVERNRGHYLDYLQELGEIPGMEPVRFDERERANYRYVVFEIEPERFGASRDDLVRLLHAENVLARRYFFPGCHRMAPYRDRGPDAGHRLPVTERLASSTLCLPTGDQLGPGAVAAIGSILRTAHIHAGQLRRQLAERSRRRHR